MENKPVMRKTKIEEVRDMKKRPTMSKIKEEERVMGKKSIEKKTREEKKLPILDIYQAAYLALKGIEPKLRKEGSRVVFTFRASSAVLERLRMYNLNPSLPILDYVAEVRRLRSQMVSMRD